jgi:hypothetical protein
MTRPLLRRQIPGIEHMFSRLRAWDRTATTVTCAPPARPIDDRCARASPDDDKRALVNCTGGYWIPLSPGEQEYWIDNSTYPWRLAQTLDRAFHVACYAARRSRPTVDHTWIAHPPGTRIPNY